MRLNRNVLWWIFAFTCLRYMIISARSIPYAVHRQHALPLGRSLLLFPTFSIAVTVVCGVAWWTLWKGGRSARSWAIAASLMYILTFLRQFIIPVGLIRVVPPTRYPPRPLLETQVSARPLSRGVNPSGRCLPTLLKKANIGNANTLDVSIRLGSSTGHARLTHD